MLVLLAVILSDGRAFSGVSGLLAQALGFLLVLAATLWRIWATLFIAGRKDVEVVDSGPYGRCRHPLYLGSFVAAAGLGLTSRSIVITLGLAALLGGAFWLAIRREEAELLARHGEAWRRYRARVPAFLPSFDPVVLPARREVDLPVFRKAFLDAASVLSLWLAIVALDTLRTAGAWRSLFALP